VATTWRPNLENASKTAPATAAASAMNTPGGTGSTLASSLIMSPSRPRASASIFCSSASPFARPLSPLIVPSVTMNGVILSVATSAPLSAPHRAPAAIPASAATRGPWPARAALAVTTVTSATTEPTERSMPPCTMTRVMPTAHSATTTV
jgi:hypothetical protein